MKILAIPDFVLPQIDDTARRSILDAAGPGGALVVATSRQKALAAAPGSEVLLGLIDEELFALMPELRWVHLTASGADELIFPALRDGPVLLTGEKGLVGPHLADHAMALLLALVRKVQEAVRDGPDSWARRFDMRRRMLELEGLEMAILGFGGTGRALARRAQGFGMKVRALDSAAMAGTEEVPEVAPLSALDELLAAADVVALCLPLTPETRHIIDARRLAVMKPGGLLINVTRGELVAPEALIAALASGRLGGAGLDVVHREPLPPDDPLWDQPNVVLTPHTAGASQLRAGRNLARFVDNLGRLKRGERLIGLVDKELGY